MTLTAQELAQRIRDVPDFPKPGVLFKDITTLLKDSEAFHAAIELMSDPFVGQPIDLVAGMESRGFLFAAPVALRLGAGVIPVRKMGRLPAEAIQVEYALEYGTNTLEIHRDAVQPGQRVLIVDDVLATGGTLCATIQLVERLGGVVAGIAFLVELTFLGGREKLKGHEPLVSIIQY